MVINKVKNYEHLDRDSSWKLVSSLIAEVEELFSDVSIYPINLTFHQDDVPSIRQLDVLSFVRRVQTVVFEGNKRMVIKPNHSETTGESSGSTEWHYGMADPNVWAWEQPTSLSGILQSTRVTAVKSLLLAELAGLVVELSWFVSGGDINWTTTKTFRLLSVKREGFSAEEILLNQKLRNIQTLKLTEFAQCWSMSQCWLIWKIWSLSICLTRMSLTSQR